MRIAIIPARGGSKRFPRKNIALLAGRPLLFYAVSAARKSGVFDRIIVSTEDTEIRELAQKLKAETMDRDSHLAGDDASVAEVCIDVINRCLGEGMQIESICVLLPTCPLRTAEDIIRAHKRFQESHADYLMTTTDYGYSPFRALKEDKGLLVPFFGMKYMKQDQKNPKVCVHNGAIIFAQPKALMSDRTFYGRNVAGMHMPRERSIDINEPFDLKIAEVLMNENKTG
jgi:pseudaminic acid cytidylyltransferase